MMSAAKTTRRQAIGLGAAGLAAVVLAGCGESLEQRFTRIDLPEDPFPPASLALARPSVRTLNRLGYGPKPGEIARMEKMGFAAYLAQQLEPEKIAEDAACVWRVGSLSDILTTDTGLLFDEDDHRVVQALRQATLLRAVYTRRQLFERVVEFWSDHFNIYAFKGEGPQLKVVDDHETIRKHALGGFRGLLGASARSAAMLGYLDNDLNRRGVPNENYARELMELHTLGLHGGYTQRDVHEVARCFTGWNYNRGLCRGRFAFDPRVHDYGEKHVLGHTVSAGGGVCDGERVLDIVASHPATARHLAGKLCMRFLGHSPEATLTRVASAFQTSFGDTKTVLRGLLTEQNMAAAPAILRRPYDYMVAALRTFDVDTDCGAGVQAHLEAMGQLPFGWPMPNGYPDQPRARLGGLIPRWNFALALSAGRIENTSVDLQAIAAAGRRAGLAPGDALLEMAFGVSHGAPEVASLRRTLSGNAEPALSAALVLMSPHFQWR